MYFGVVYVDTEVLVSYIISDVRVLGPFCFSFHVIIPTSANSTYRVNRTKSSGSIYVEFGVVRRYMGV